MAVTEEIAWGDGSGDKIYLTANALEGNQIILVSSDANASASSRSKIVTFTTGNISRVLTVEQEAGVVEPIFYNYLYFTQPAYIDTEYYVPNLPSFNVSLGKETVQSGMQRIINFGSGSNLISVQYTSNTTASSGRRWGIYYGTSTNGTNRTLAWSYETLNFWITYSRFGVGTNSYTYTKGTNMPTNPLRFGGTTNSYTGRMGTFYVYDNSTQNVTSLSGLSSYTPVATFRPCTYGGAAGFWHVEARKFYGNSASSGSLTASNT